MMRGKGGALSVSCFVYGPVPVSVLFRFWSPVSCSYNCFPACNSRNLFSDRHRPSTTFTNRFIVITTSLALFFFLCGALIAEAWGTRQDRIGSGGKRYSAYHVGRRIKRRNVCVWRREIYVRGSGR
ncbi:hypothetical protein FB45DRAFT_905542 [Roridomyces roridus]|uniref:Uncharacterized protein n=1 Tax=Roridomyces roridus TaxID=1738132 RepID=A0AAD7C5Q2_9AGAR|nr:hypothetical protein FB45DRAFT_905542 [Roridomyces roridus]